MIAAVGIVELASPRECERAAELLQSLWRGAAPPLSASMIRTVQQTGGYAFGAYDVEGNLLAVCLGLLAREGTLHSKITGVVRVGQRGGLGLQLKQHQRLWALERGMGTITWTCDPLVRRNVMFNLHGLGAGVRDYLPDHYGRMDDGVNHRDESDRFVIAWDLNGPLALKALQGRLPYVDSALPEAVAGASDDGARLIALEGAARRVQLPSDIEALRRRDPVAAASWRLAVRDAVLPALERGAVIRGATADAQLVLA